MNADGNNQIRLTTNSWVDSYPSWSADGQKIAFQSHREGSQGMDIYIMNADGSNQTRLTNNTSPDYFPIWLGNGKIAFTSERDGNTEIYIMNADGSDQTRLTNNTMSDSFRGYSPYVPGQQPSLPQQPALPLP
jgi:Tol biopolymer transport system component